MGFVTCGWFVLACDFDKAEPAPDPVTKPALAQPQVPPPRELYLPQRQGLDLEAAQAEAKPRRLCPPEMVFVDGAFCVDRYEIVLEVDVGLLLSPHYPPTPLAARLHTDWVELAPKSRGRLGLLSVPEPSAIDLLQKVPPRAVSKKGVLPQGYLSKIQAERACAQAGKRLCTEVEWLTACSGEKRSPFPYGQSYAYRSCNVHRTSHPATLLHGDPSRNHLDPRLLLTYDDDGPLLHRTGETPVCASVWGDDAIFDMVGNLDEWVGGPGAVFLGGFFSRATTQGCLARISSHRPDYFDYSLGTRCCSTPGQ